MQTITKRVLLAVGALALLVAAVTPQQAGDTLRTRTLTIQSYFLPLGQNYNGRAPGLSGRVLYVPFSGITKARGTRTGTGSLAFGATPYATKLAVRFTDTSSNSGTLNCPSVKIWGLDGRYLPVNEILTSVNETVQYTVNAYSQLDGYNILSTCDKGGADDALVMDMSNKVGLPMPVRGYGSIVSICKTLAAGSLLSCLSGSDLKAITFSNMTVDLSAVRFCGETVGLASCPDAQSAAPTTGDKVLITIKADPQAGYE